jgi:hypothetical protein
MRPALRHPQEASGVVRYLYEISLSITLASAFLTKLINSNEIHWSSQYFGWEMGLNHSLHRSSTAMAGQTLAFCVWCLTLAGVVFLLLRIVSLFAVGTKVIRAITGVLVVTAPAACLWLVGLYRPADPLWGDGWLRLEACAAAGCALLYLCGRWRVSGPITVALTTIHGALWVHAYSVAFEVFGPHWLTVPIAAYCSTLTWGYYVRCQSQHGGASRDLLVPE